MSCSTPHLPLPIIVDILSRLPAKNIIHCWCVCKTWRNLLSGPYFANLHLSRSPTTIITLQYGALELVELEDQPHHHHLHWDRSMTFHLKLGFQHLVGSINGLLCLCNFKSIYIGNPITRECITVPTSKYERQYPAAVVNAAFGFSSVTGKYKVVRIFQGNVDDPTTGLSSFKSECEVYTLGTGRWKSIGHVPFLPELLLNAVSLNDNLHWLAYEEDSPALICSFDIEKEQFRSMSAHVQSTLETINHTLGVLGGCLCVCDSSYDSETVFWVMKDYGVEESWSKEFVIDASVKWMPNNLIHPLKVLKDGAILMFWPYQNFLSYSPTRRFLAFGTNVAEALLHVASFLSLRDFVMENVDVF